MNVEAGVAYNACKNLSITNRVICRLLTKAAFYALENSVPESQNLTGFTVSQRSNLTSDIWSSARIQAQNLSAFDYTHFVASLVSNEPARTATIPSL